MQRHWARCGPPTYMAVALYLGLGAARPRPSDQLNDPADLAAFLKSFPGAAGA